MTASLSACSPLMETPFVSQLATSTKMAAGDAWWAAASRRHLFSTADSRGSAGNNIWLHLSTREGNPNMPCNYYNVYLQLLINSWTVTTVSSTSRITWFLFQYTFVPHSPTTTFWKKDVYIKHHLFNTESMHVKVNEKLHLSEGSGLFFTYYIKKSFTIQYWSPVTK